MKKYICLMMVMALCAPGFVFAGDVLEGNQTFSKDGSQVTIANTITYSGVITAIGVRVTAPEGWTLASVGGKNIPGISPKEGESGVLEFAWIQPPPKVLAFEYTLTVPQGETGEVTAEIIYRREAGELRSPMLPDPLTVE